LLLPQFTVPSTDIGWLDDLPVTHCGRTLRPTFPHSHICSPLRYTPFVTHLGSFTFPTFGLLRWVVYDFAHAFRYTHCVYVTHGCPVDLCAGYVLYGLRLRLITYVILQVARAPVVVPLLRTLVFTLVVYTTHDLQDGCGSGPHTYTPVGAIPRCWLPLLHVVGLYVWSLPRIAAGPRLRSLPHTRLRTFPAGGYRLPVAVAPTHNIYLRWLPTRTHGWLFILICTVTFTFILPAVHFTHAHYGSTGCYDVGCYTHTFVYYVVHYV